MSLNNVSFIANPSLKIDHVDLKVSKLEESVSFYQSILGFRILKKESDKKIAFLVSDALTEGKDKSSPSPLLVLTQLNNDNIINHSINVKKEARLYHFAILLPERKYLASFLRHIQKNLDPQYYEGMADHAVSESIYIHDPDYNGIEIYRDRSPSEWKWNGNKIHMVTEPLHVTNLLNQYSNEIWKALPPNTSIGHVHLHVSNLIRAKKFYHDILGLNHTASYPGAYFFASNGYHHHVATNTWIGTNILPANNNNDQNKPGLDHYAIIISEDNKEEIGKFKNHFVSLGILIDEKLLESDSQYMTSFYVYDPDGIKIQFLFI